MAGIWRHEEEARYPFSSRMFFFFSLSWCHFLVLFLFYISVWLIHRWDIVLCWDPFFYDFGVQIFFPGWFLVIWWGFLVFRAWLLISVTGFVWIGRFSVCRLVADGMDLIRVLDKRCFQILICLFSYICNCVISDWFFFIYWFVLWIYIEIFSWNLSELSIRNNKLQEKEKKNPCFWVKLYQFHMKTMILWQ